MTKRIAPAGGTPKAAGETAPAERGQHGSDLAVGRDGVQVVRTAIDTLLADRTLGAAEVWAGGRWERDYKLAVENASDGAGGSGGGGFGGFMDAKVAASLSYEAACEAVGKDGTALLIACVAYGRSLRSLSGGDRHKREWLAGALAFTLKRLAEHYANPPRRPRPATAGVPQMAA